MTGSKLFLIASLVSTAVLAACAAPGTYPLTGDGVSSGDPVKTMEAPAYMYGVEAR